MMWPLYGGCKSLSVKNCNYALFQQLSSYFNMDTNEARNLHYTFWFCISIVLQLIKTSGASVLSGDMVAKWIVHGTLNMQVVGLNLSAAVGQLCNILGQDVNSMYASPYQGVKL